MPNFWLNFVETIQSSKVAPLIILGLVMVLVIGGLSALSHHYTLNGIKSRTVGDGQHGTARWATPKEIKRTCAHIPSRSRSGAAGKTVLPSRGWCWDAKARRTSP